MSAFHTDDKTTEIDKPAGSSDGPPKELRAGSVTLVWAVSAFIATAGWLYLLGLATCFIVRWVVG